MGLSSKEKKAIIKRDGGKCLLCGTTKHLTVDHIVPKALGGDDSPKNLQTLCEYHNKIKGCRSTKDYRGRKGLPVMDPYLCEK